MKFVTQKRIAAQLLKVGTSKIWFDPSKLTEIKEAITKSDIRSLIKSKAIKVKKTQHQSRFRARKRKDQRKKGNQMGPGSRKGKKTSRSPRKTIWIAKIRIQRKFLAYLKAKKLVEPSTYKDLMTKSKGGFFRNKRHIKIYLAEKNLFKKNA